MGLIRKILTTSDVFLRHSATIMCRSAALPDVNHMLLRPSVPPVHDAASNERAVYRGAAEIRRGVPVLIKRNERSIIVLPTQTATAETLAEFMAVQGRANGVLGEPLFLLSISQGLDGRVGAVPIAGTTDMSILTLKADQLTIDRLREQARPSELLASQANMLLPKTDVVFPRSHAEAAIKLSKIAGLLPSMLVRTGILASSAGALITVDSAAIMGFSIKAGTILVRAAEARVPLDGAEDARFVAFRPPDGGTERLAILIGRPEACEAPLTRLHSERFTADLLGGPFCNLGLDLHQAIRRMAAEGAGVLLYMAPEGGRIGLQNELPAFSLQDPKLDAWNAKKALELGASDRDFSAAASMLKQLGVSRVRLLTNHLENRAGLTAHGIEVTGCVSHVSASPGEDSLHAKIDEHRFSNRLGAESRRQQEHEL